jgi:uncharacterized protein (DUF433 family)
MWGQSKLFHLRSPPSLIVRRISEAHPLFHCGLHPSAAPHRAPYTPYPTGNAKIAEHSPAPTERLSAGGSTLPDRVPPVPLGSASGGGFIRAVGRGEERTACYAGLPLALRVNRIEYPTTRVHLGEMAQSAEIDTRIATNRAKRMEWRGRISTDPHILVGKPVIKGTRISVDLILGWLANGWSVEDVLLSYPHITREDVQAAIAFAAEMLREEEYIAVYKASA